MSKSISRDEMRRRVEEAQGSGGAGEQGEEGAAAAETTPEPVRVTTWAVMRNYECGECAYATLDVAQMVGHLKAVHGWRETVASGQWLMSREEAGGTPAIHQRADASAAVAGDEINQDEVK